MLDFNRFNRPNLPDIRAVEAAECGLACMAMIACYFGHRTTLNSLRQRFSLSMAGATLRSLIVLADNLDLSTRALRAEIDDLPHLSTPAILHWDFNHFVVLKEVRGSRCFIHDPKSGPRKLTLEQLSRHFTGVALELTPTANFVAIEDEKSLSLAHLWSGARGFSHAFTQLLCLSAALQIVTFVAPFQLQIVVDDVLMSGDRNLLTVIAAAFSGLIFFQVTLEAMRSWILQVYGQSLSFQMVGNVVRHLLRLPTHFFEKRQVGDIISRVESANSIQEIITKGIVSSLIDGVMAVIALIIMFVYSPFLALIVLASVTINIVLSLLIFPVQRQRSQEQIVEDAREKTHLMESVRAATTIRLMGGEAEREASWRNIYARVVNASVAVNKLQIGQTAAQSAVNGLQAIAVLYVAAGLILEARGFSVGMLVAFLSFRQTFSDRTTTLISQITQFRFIRLHLERLSDIVQTPREKIDPFDSSEPPSNTIELQDVSFRYGASDRMILNNVNLSISRNEFVAFTGPSGGGKTTLSKLILGLLEPTGGRILLDGQPATPAMWRRWREKAGVVSQDDRLLSGTIADNISFFDTGVDMEKVRSAAAAARISADIARMPMQFLSLVGDMGSALSGGQKQRILLARALYRQPAVIVLDEGTANLDVETESMIADLLVRLETTRIIVAHRPALLERAERIFLVENGFVVERTSSGETPSLDSVRMEKVA